LRADALALGMAGADRPADDAVLREILRRIGFKKPRRRDQRRAHRVRRRLGPARGDRARLRHGSIAWGENARGEIARAGGWGWHLGDEGSGFWIGERAIRKCFGPRMDGARRRRSTGRSWSTSRFEKPSEILHASTTGVSAAQVALFAVRVAEAAAGGDAVAGRILADAAEELALAARSVIARLDLERAPYDVVLSGGTFAALPALEAAVREKLARPPARVHRLEEEPAMGAVRLAREELGRSP
jgi:N-acetylglucosamine kinase-like BadF-type ATPase